MCGICGAVSTHHSALRAGATAGVEAMLGALAHRGPDSSGLAESRGAVLGATRLAIRGLHDGRQPLLHGETGITAVCNGEIDNHRELRQWLADRGRRVAQATDVAIIPELYLALGDAFPERLVGAFAIALWDPRRERLLLVRDRAGERPLFFRRAGEEVIFATELAALAAYARPPALDREALAWYLRFGCFASPMTPFEGVEKVGPGERVVIDAAGVRRERYWRWRHPSPGRPAPAALSAAGSPNAAGASAAEPSASASSPGHCPPAPPTLDELDEVFRRAVRRQTDVEVPCGVYLSGGVDSSLVTAVARAVRPEQPLTAFTLRFSEDSYDEGAIAEKVARGLGLTPRPVWVRPEDFPQCLPELVRLAGEPLADPAWVPAALLSRRAADEVKTALVGEGGDEIFGGYPTYTGVWLGERYGRLPRRLRQAAEALVRSLPPSEKKVTVSYLLKRFVAGASLDGLERHLLWTSNLAPEMIARLGVPPPLRPLRRPLGTSGSEALDEASVSGGALLDRVQQHDLETSLAEGLLTKSDRASMHFAVELRAPFLDRDVLGLGARLSEAQRVRGFATKTFLKRYARRYLPRWVVHRRKRGLSVPLAAWLRGPLAGWAESRLVSGALAEAGVDPAAALALFAEHRRREHDHARALWTLIVLAEWLEWVRGARSVRLADGAPAQLVTAATLPDVLAPS
jgi:asparagine synthase (glutamine-hydrolysing)